MGRRLRPLLVAVMTAALLLEPARSTTLRSHSTLQLSVPRTDLGAATAGGAAVFGGGCSKGSSGGGKTGGSCVSPSAAIDILRPARSTADGPAHPDDTWVLAESPAALSAARGWAATCSFGTKGDTVAFLGGGQPGGSTVLDLLDVSTGAVRTNATALPRYKGRWGTSCAGSATQLTFGGGKLWPKMRGEVYVLPAGASGGGSISGLALVGELSEAREDCGAVVYGSTGSLFAGGWVSNTEPGNPSIVIDTFDTDPQAAQHSVWATGLGKPGLTQEWVGAVAYNESLVFVADATTLYEIGSHAVFTGKALPITRPLPKNIAASAGIPAARVQQNGVRIPGAVCFYASAPSSVLACWSPQSKTWQQLKCSASHVAGAITAVDGTVFVGGGYDGSSLTAAVDVFAFGEEEEDKLK